MREIYFPWGDKEADLAVINYLKELYPCTPVHYFYHPFSNEILLLEDEVAVLVLLKFPILSLLHKDR